MDEFVATRTEILPDQVDRGTCTQFFKSAGLTRSHLLRREVSGKKLTFQLFKPEKRVVNDLIP